jgi:Transglutaminase-like superfamily
MEDALQQIVSPSDSNEIKLQKIYARSQQIRNLSFERRETQQEQGREKLKGNDTVEDVWKRGYGNHYDINGLFLALARAAGFEAHMVRVSTRDEYFFNPQLMDAFELNANVVQVKLDGKNLYFDPGTAFTPYGLLPWHETAVQGRRLDKDGGTWVQTPLPEPSQSRQERKALLKLTDDGSLAGKLTVTFTGLDALWRRLDELDEDDTSRTKFLEDEVRRAIPASAEVKLTNQPEWSSSSPLLVAEYQITVPGWASPAGRRQLIPVGLFGEPEKHMFEHTERTFPVYFHYPFQVVDDITLELPPGWQVSSLLPPQNVGGNVAHYTLAADDKNGLHWTRLLSMDILQMQTKYYPALQNFYQKVRTGDEQQIVLSPK